MDSPYTSAERAFLRGQSCGRLVSVDPEHGPAVSAVLYQMQGDVLVAGGVDLAATPAWAEISRTGRAVFVVDDVVPGAPGTCRGVRVEAVVSVDHGRLGPVCRLRPTAVRSWGLEVGSLRS